MASDNPRPNGDPDGTFGDVSRDPSCALRARDRGHRDRAGDKSAMARLADNAVVALASRLAFLVVLSVVTWMTARFVNTLDGVAKDAAELSKNVAVISATVNGHEKRIEKIETKVFR